MTTETAVKEFSGVTFFGATLLGQARKVAGVWGVPDKRGQGAPPLTDVDLYL